MPAKTLPVVHDGFMKPGEAARELGCGERWLRDGANHRGFPHHRLGKFLQFSRQDRDEIRGLCRIPAHGARTAPRRRPNGAGRPARPGA
ncbi:hypothetical protein [Streptomyces chrestomyceticus]|uniref:hypothetical protein n=1 Tax=Streptomyces chrestomyceticus TaxID=68185 RepID=UPI0037A0E82E